MEYCCHVRTGAPSCCLELLDKLQKWICRTVGPSLTASLEPLAHHRNVASLSLFYRYYFGRCSSELAQLVPLPFSQGRSTCYSDRLHDFSVTIPRCYKDTFFPCFKRFSACFNLLVLLFLVTPCLVVNVQSGMEWIPIKRKRHKAIGPNSIPTQILKELKIKFSELLSDIDVSFKTGIISDFLKLEMLLLCIKKWKTRP